MVGENLKELSLIHGSEDIQIIKICWHFGKLSANFLKILTYAISKPKKKVTYSSVSGLLFKLKKKKNFEVIQHIIMTVKCKKDKMNWLGISGLVECYTLCYTECYTVCSKYFMSHILNGDVERPANFTPSCS